MNKGIRILLLAEALFLTAEGFLGPIWAIYVEKIGGDILDASGAYAAFMITAALITYFLGKFEQSQRFKSKFVVFGYLLGTLGFVGYLFVDNIWQLLVVQMILGLTVAIKDPAYDGLYSKFAKKHLTLAWGEWEAMDYVALGVSAVLGGIIARFLGFKSLILIMVAFSLLGFFVSLSLLHLGRLKRS